MAATARALAPVACLLAAVALAASASAQSSGGCTTTLISLYPCLNYISGNVSAPPASCCSSLGSVVRSSPQCLCAALSGDSSSLGGITIDKNRALQLPKACNVQTPPASRCNSTGGGNAPGAATTPAATPSGATTDSGSVVDAAGTGTGSKTTPTSPYMVSGGASLRREAASLVLASAAAALYAVASAV